MQQIELHPDDYLPASPPQEVVQHYGIAVVGCGNIARNTHLPALPQVRIPRRCSLRRY